CPARGAARKPCTADAGPRLLSSTTKKPGSRVCSPPFRFATRCAAPGTRVGSAVAEQQTSFRTEELLADVIAGLIGDARHVAVGAASPIPAAAALLARTRGNGRPRVSLLGSRRQSFFTDGGRELFDCAGQGRIDVFFLSGGQIDGEGNVNLVSIGDYQQPKVRFPG